MVVVDKEKMYEMCPISRTPEIQIQFLMAHSLLAQ